MMQNNEFTSLVWDNEPIALPKFLTTCKQKLADKGAEELKRIFEEAKQ